MLWLICERPPSTSQSACQQNGTGSCWRGTEKNHPSLPIVVDTHSVVGYSLRMATQTLNIQVAAVKKTQHGGYGRQLAVVTVPVVVTDGFADERAIHAAARVQLQQLLPGLKIATRILEWPTH